MDRFLFKIPKPPSVQTPIINEESSKRAREEINLDELPADPIDRKIISSYNPNDRDRVRRAYLQRGPYQPRNHKFPQKVIGKVKRRFCVGWFKTHKPWLEYSVKVDAAFCLFCYLCADYVDEDDDTSFVTEGFSNWKKNERLKVHVGGLNSSHNQCRRKCEDLMNQDYNIFDRQTDQNKLDYETRLLASVDCVRFLLVCGLAFLGNDESEGSSNVGNFRDLLKFLADHCEEIRKRKDVDIVNAMKLVQIAKQRLETMRNDGREHLDKEVSLFCHKYTICIPNMNDAYELPGRPRRVAHKVTIRHHYEIEIFKAVIDWMLQELNNRFSEATTELLSCMACLSPDDSFSSFDKDKLVRLVEFYPSDFSATDRDILDDQFETFLWDMKSSIQFRDLKGIGCLAAKLVETKKHKVYQLFYRLIKLVLILPVLTASVERSFSAMKLVKTRLSNKMGDDWLNHCLVTYIEKEVFQGIDNELVIQKFQTMGPRRGQLPKR